jgi:hypothetical protein
LLFFIQSNRIKFTDVMDRILLVETVHYNPFSAVDEKAAWASIGVALTSNCPKIPYACTERTAKDRVTLLLKQFKSEDGLKRNR